MYKIVGIFSHYFLYLLVNNNKLIDIT